MRVLTSTILAAALFLAAVPIAAQEILLDKVEQAAGLTVFQSFDDEKVWYYLPDRPRVSERNGKPQFSFMKFVTNEETEGEGGTTGAQGGGIVHFLVEFDVPETVVQRAEQELSRRVQGARIAGPIIYRSGTFSLVSSFIEEGGEYTHRVLGLGKAPILEGHKAAVSILLKKEGATLLWENFKMATPDISLQFEMTVAGYREPFEAELVGNWGLIAQNRTVNVGLASPVLGIDIQAAMKEMEQNGAIQITQKGSDQASEAMINQAYGKLVELIFEQQNNPAVTATLADDQNAFSNFERASQYNTAQRQRVAAENAALERRGGVRTPRRDYPAARIESGSSSGSGAGSRGSGGQREGEGDQQASEGEGQASGQSGSGGSEGSGSGGGERQNPYDVTENREDPPSFALLASYRVKSIKTSGTFRLSFNKFTEDTLAFPIAENVGPLYQRWGGDTSIFREVNLDDPVYKQRELIVFLDGQDADDFTNYVNYVTVSMRKKHQNNQMTTDELRIDKNNFQSDANNFRLLYGWKGDDDRAKWLQYEYKTNWSFHGGVNKESDWQTADDFNITVAPPHRYRTILLEADPDILADEGVRLTTITFYYNFFGKELSETVSMRTNDEDLAKEINYTHEPGNVDYEYEITWRVRGKGNVSSGRLQGNEEVIFVDELPEGGE